MDNEHLRNIVDALPGELPTSPCEVRALRITHLHPHDPATGEVGSVVIEVAYGMPGIDETSIACLEFEVPQVMLLLEELTFGLRRAVFTELCEEENEGDD